MNRLLIVLACLIIGLPTFASRTASQKEPSRNGMPDFAFPQTVIENTHGEIKKFIDNRDYANALRAAMQQTIANGLIDKNRTMGSIKLIDSIAESMPNNYKALARLIDAQIYLDFYQTNRGAFNSRTLPLDHFPDDLNEWSRGLFAKKIVSLVKESVGLVDGDGLPLSKIAPVLTSVEMEFLIPAEKDFISYKSVDILDRFASDTQLSIPFRTVGESQAPQSSSPYSEAALLASELIDKTIENYRQRGKTYPLAYAMSVKANRLRGDKLDGWLEKCYTELQTTPASIIILDKMAESGSLDSYLYSDKVDSASVARAKKFYDRASDALKKWPEDYGAVRLSNAIQTLTSTVVRTNTKSQFTTEDNVKVSVAISNTPSSHILLFRLPDSQTGGSEKVSSIIANSKVIKSIPIKTACPVPCRTDTSVDFGKLPFGIYAAIPSASPSAQGIPANVASSRVRPFRISNMRNMSFTVNGEHQSRRVYVVDAINGSPVAGAKVEFRKYKNNRIVTNNVLFTDKDGFVNAPQGSWQLRISKGKDILLADSYLYASGKPAERTVKGTGILTDLSIYHPGDQVGYAVIAYKSSGHEYSLLCDTAVTVNLRDANHNIVSTQQLTTDKHGRASGKFTLPVSGLLGRWCLESEFGKEIGNYSYFEVSDYKAPEFFVEIDSVDTSAESDNKIFINGKVRTFSGMPVQDASIDFDIRYVSFGWWRGISAPDATYASSAKADSDGKFRICLDTEFLKDTPYAFGAYRLNLRATSASGETQEANPATFALGSAYSINPDIPSRMNAAQAPESFKVNVYDILGKPAKKPVSFSITDKSGTKLHEGVFNSPTMTFDMKTLPSGKYDIRFNIAGADTTASATSSFILYRLSDTVPPVSSRLWIPERSITAKPGEKQIEVCIGSSYPDSHILCYATDASGKSETRWLKVNGRNESVTVSAPRSGERKWLTFATVGNLQTTTGAVEILPAETAGKLEVKSLSFRDRTTPGDTEKWEFLFTFAGKPASYLPTMAVMSDKSLNSIAPFRWNLAPQGASRFYNPLSYDAYSAGNIQDSFVLRKIRNRTEKNYQFPDWQTYGYRLVPASYMRDLRIRGAMAKTVHADMVKDEIATEEVLTTVSATALYAGAPSAKNSAGADSEKFAMEESADEGSGNQSDETTQMRDTECPLAWFMPNLETDNNGIQKISFTVPNFNTTWQMQILGYTPQLKSTTATFETTSAKAVMVSTNTPRFLRTGDEATISATLYNAADSAAMIHGKIEIYDPENGNVIASIVSPEKLTAASGSDLISISFTVPDNIQYVLLKAWAISPAHSDGEQYLIRILPSSTPVTESTAFYINPDNKEFKTQLPVYSDNASVTLQYCDNPVWYCLTALPSISRPDSKSLLTLLSAYYGSATSSGLIRKYPSLREGLEKIIASEPSSPLAENSELKTVELINTPWINNASAETARMQSLSSLMTDATPTLSRLLDDIVSLQNQDGGWSWCPGMKSSQFMTQKTLLRFGQLIKNGYAPDDSRIDRAIRKGMDFMDRQILDIYRNGDNTLQPREALEWLYPKVFLKKIQETKPVSAIHQKAVGIIKDNWRTYSIADKARAAIVLNDASHSETARMILESLRQNATVSPTLGMRFVNLPSGFDGSSPLLATAQVLEAFAIIDPASPCIDQLRQGLIIQRETEDWGNNAATVDLVQAILTSGSEWTGVSAEPEIIAGGKRLSSGKSDSPVGYYKINLPAAELSGSSIEIRKGGDGPAWGSVMAQYVAPIQDVKAASMPEISISKKINTVIDQPGETVSSTLSLKKGDKVRVTLTFTTDRDMDYVAVTDSRSACLEPVNQLSGYIYSDGLWLYREIRDDSTNLFISFLPKGTHVITYDCFVDRQGCYSLGIASAQSQYAPQITAHSEGIMLTVE